jgi:hypothetical protein
MIEIYKNTKLTIEQLRKRLALDSADIKNDKIIY